MYHRAQRDVLQSLHCAGSGCNERPFNLNCFALSCAMCSRASRHGQEEYIDEATRVTFASLKEDFVGKLCEDSQERKILRFVPCRQAWAR